MDYLNMRRVEMEDPRLCITLGGAVKLSIYYTVSLKLADLAILARDNFYVSKGGP